MQLQSRNPVIFNADIELQPGKNLSSAQQEHLRQYYDRFKSKKFFHYETEELPNNMLQNALKTEEKSFFKTYAEVLVSQVPSNVNAVSRHVLY